MQMEVARRGGWACVEKTRVRATLPSRGGDGSPAGGVSLINRVAHRKTPRGSNSQAWLARSGHGATPLPAVVRRLSTGLSAEAACATWSANQLPDMVIFSSSGSQERNRLGVASGTFSRAQAVGKRVAKCDLRNPPPKSRNNNLEDLDL